MDGLLLDSERLHLECFSFAIESLGYEIKLDAYRACIGTTAKKSDEILMAAYGPEFKLDQLKDIWERRYHGLIDDGHLEVKPGAVELLASAMDAGITCALATSTGRATTMKKLALAQLEQHFVFIVTGDDVSRSKPHPEPYAKAAIGLGIAPGHCWALEDSENGVRAALAAGCHVFQVPDLVEPTAQVRALGHEVVDSLHVVSRRLATVVAAD